MLGFFIYKLKIWVAKYYLTKGTLEILATTDIHIYTVCMSV